MQDFDESVGWAVFEEKLAFRLSYNFHFNITILYAIFSCLIIKEL